MVVSESHCLALCVVDDDKSQLAASSTSTTRVCRTRNYYTRTMIRRLSVLPDGNDMAAAGGSVSGRIRS
jgi:hypothetical protein